MCQVALTRILVVLREAAQREPHLVVESQLLVLREPMLDVLHHDCLSPRGMEGGVAHVGEVLRQADHLGALVSTLLDQARTRFVVAVGVLGRTELHQAYDTFESVLFR